MSGCLCSDPTGRQAWCHTMSMHCKQQTPVEELHSFSTCSVPGTVLRLTNISFDPQKNPMRDVINDNPHEENGTQIYSIICPSHTVNKW